MQSTIENKEYVTASLITSAVIGPGLGGCRPDTHETTIHVPRLAA